MANGDGESKITLNIFGKSVSIEGLGTIFVVVILILGGGLGWMLYDLSHAAAQAVREALVVQQQTAVEHKAIMEAALYLKESQALAMEGIKHVDSSVKTQNWILLADPHEKADIKRRLAMPRELRDLGVRERERDQ